MTTSPFAMQNLHFVSVGADIIRPRALDKRPYKFFRTEIQILQRTFLIFAKINFVLCAVGEQNALCQFNAKYTGVYIIKIIVTIIDPF